MTTIYATLLDEEDDNRYGVVLDSWTQENLCEELNGMLDPDEEEERITLDMVPHEVVVEFANQYASVVDHNLADALMDLQSEIKHDLINTLLNRKGG